MVDTAVNSTRTVHRAEASEPHIIGCNMGTRVAAIRGSWGEDGETQACGNSVLAAQISKSVKFFEKSEGRLRLKLFIVVSPPGQWDWRCKKGLSLFFLSFFSLYSFAVFPLFTERQHESTPPAVALKQGKTGTPSTNPWTVEGHCSMATVSLSPLSQAFCFRVSSQCGEHPVTSPALGRLTCG